MVRAEDSRTHNQEDVGSNTTAYWMDVSLASYYIERKTIKVDIKGTPKKNQKYFIRCSSKGLLCMQSLKLMILP